jgi:Domain of unknown function (DUF6968)
MDFDTLGEIIATRKLHYVDGQSVRRTVSVLIGKPQPIPNVSAYSCAFQIIGVGNQETNLASGHDAIQALQSAINLIDANLDQLNDELGGRLRWDKDSGELGFAATSRL